jgi:hypothetical protein
VSPRLANPTIPRQRLAHRAPHATGELPLAGMPPRSHPAPRSSRPDVDRLLAQLQAWSDQEFILVLLRVYDLAVARDGVGLRPAVDVVQRGDEFSVCAARHLDLMTAHSPLDLHNLLARESAPAVPSGVAPQDDGVGVSSLEDARRRSLRRRVAAANREAKIPYHLSGALEAEVRDRLAAWFRAQTAVADQIVIEAGPLALATLRTEIAAVLEKSWGSASWRSEFSVCHLHFADVLTGSSTVPLAWFAILDFMPSEDVGPSGRTSAPGSTEPRATLTLAPPSPRRT